MTAAGVRLSDLDTARWGVVTARADGVTAASLPDVLAFARARAVVLLVARCDAADLAAVHAMEAAGFRLMDTLVAYARRVAPTDGRGGSGGPERGRPAAGLVRPVAIDEAAAVRALALSAFRGYRGHYHADPRLDAAACDDVYADWAHRACVSGDPADAVLVADVDGQVAAFATIRAAPPAEGEGVLFGVAPTARGRGLYPSLMEGALELLASRGCARMRVSTQITNLVVQRAWTRLGFEPSGAHYTFHRWSIDASAPASRAT